MAHCSHTPSHIPESGIMCAVRRSSLELMTKNTQPAAAEQDKQT